MLIKDFQILIPQLKI